MQPRRRPPLLHRQQRPWPHRAQRLLLRPVQRRKLLRPRPPQLRVERTQVPRQRQKRPVSAKPIGTVKAAPLLRPARAAHAKAQPRVNPLPNRPLADTTKQPKKKVPPAKPAPRRNVSGARRNLKLNRLLLRKIA